MDSTTFVLQSNISYTRVHINRLLIVFICAPPGADKSCPVSHSASWHLVVFDGVVGYSSTLPDMAPTCLSIQLLVFQ